MLNLIKTIAPILSLLLLPLCTDAQILKKAKQVIGQEAEWELRRKSNEAIHKGMDSLSKLPKKLKKKKQQQADSTTTNPSAPVGSGTGSSSAPKKETEPDGFISIQLSTPFILEGLPLYISGASMHEEEKEIHLRVTGKNVDETAIAKTLTNGTYKVLWNIPLPVGHYIATAKSGGKKSLATVAFDVTEWPDQDNESELIKEAETALGKLNDRAATVKNNISKADAAKLQAKLDEAKDRVDAVKDLAESLQKAQREVGKHIRGGKLLPPNYAKNISYLNQSITEKTSEIKKISSMADHEPLDMTICEYIVMLNEACAAFSTFTNFWAKSVGELIQNIILDKVVPATVQQVNSATLKVAPEPEWYAREMGKIYATSKVDAQALTTKLGKAGIAGDIVQFGTDVLLRIYCGVYKGELNHDYKIIYRNNEGETWWQYSVKMEAAVSLRYPKGQSGKPIKMKGNIEGNATNISFTADPGLEPGYKAETKGRTVVKILKTYIPPTIPFASSKNDILGFGALLRGMATPAYFNIPIDAEYDPDAGKIKLFINNALIDFLPTITNTQYFVAIAAGIPLFKSLHYDIQKAGMTIKSSLKDNNEFDVVKGPNETTSFKGKRNRKAGNHQTDITLNLDLSMKKE